MDWQALWEKAVAFCTTSGLRLIASILIVTVGFRIIKILSDNIVKTKFYGNLDATARTFFKSFITIILKIVLIIIAATIIGVPMTSVVALVGSAGLAIGLALQGSLSNIAGGFIILVFKPFLVGDFITVGTYSGTVKSISIFYTKIITLDNKKIMIPNSIISNETLTDCTAYPTRRVDLTFSVAYSSDIDEVKGILMSVAQRDELVMKDPEPFIRLAEHDSSSLNFVFRVWCRTEDYWTVNYNMIENVKKAFDENNISIPYPQLDVHVDNAGK